MRRAFIIGYVFMGVLIVGMPAAAQAIFWSATLTAERFVNPDNQTLVQIGYRRGVFGEVSDDSFFTYRGVSYGIRHAAILVEPRVLILGIQGSDGMGTFLPDDQTFALRVDDKTFVLRDAEVNGPRLVWKDPGLDWSDGQRVSLELIAEAEPAPALPLAGAGLLAWLLVAGAYRSVVRQK